MAICGCVTEPRKGAPRICYMEKGHATPHFDAIPFKLSPEKFYGSAKAYAKQKRAECDTETTDVKVNKVFMSYVLQELGLRTD